STCGCIDAGAETLDNIAIPDDNINPDGMPIDAEQATITIMSARPTTTSEERLDVSAVKADEELANVHADFVLVHKGGAAERHNLALTSGDYPETFYRTGLGTGDIAKYGEQGTFIPLNDLLDEYMPNHTAILDDNPSIREGLTYPDGNIYTLPQIYDPEFLGMRYMFKLWARQDWLDDFGMDAPETLEEYEAYLEEAVGTIDGAIGLADAVNLND